MSTQTELLNTIVEYLVTAMSRVRTELAPLESGMTRAGQAGPDGAWQDVTEERIKRLSTDVARIQRMIEKLRADYS